VFSHIEVVFAPRNDPPIQIGHLCDLTFEIRFS